MIVKPGENLPGKKFFEFDRLFCLAAILKIVLSGEGIILPSGPHKGAKPEGNH